MNYLITGANRGLGLELVREGSRLGHKICASCRNGSEELSELAGKFPDLIHIQKMDVADTASVEKASAETAERFKYLNGYINNAAVLYGSKYDTRDPVTAIDLDETLDTFNINIMGIIRVMKFFTPLVYSASGDRCIMNISSVGAIITDTGHAYASYVTSKCAVNMYTQKMRNYLASQPDKADIRVYMIHPGRMDTVMGRENAQIHPSETAQGIWTIIERRKDVYSSIPFYDYKGELMQ